MSRASQLASSLERVLAERGLPAETGGPVFVRASGIGDCARKQTYRMQSPEKAAKPSAYSMLMATQGNWVEDGVAPLFGRGGYILDHTQRELDYIVDGELILRGHIDGLIREDTGALPSDWHLWECKAMSAFRFKKLSSNGVYVADPGYFDQVQLYMTLLNNEGTRVPSCLFTAFAKDPSAVNQGNRGVFINPIYVEEIPWDAEKGTALLERARVLHAYVSSGQLGPRERTPNKDWDCNPRFCAFHAQCDPAGARLRRAA